MESVFELRPGSEASVESVYEPPVRKDVEIYSGGHYMA